MPVAKPMNQAELTNTSLWISGSRIYAGYQMGIVGQAGAVPPDVAAVVTVLQERETARFGEFVGTLQQVDGEVNEVYRRRRSRGMPVLPPDQSVLDPVYYQYGLLRSTPVIEDEWVWHDMPQELYVANDRSLPDEVRAILQDLLPEYGTAAGKAASGLPVYAADPAAVAGAKTYRVEVLPELTGFGVPRLTVEKLAVGQIIALARTVLPYVVAALSVQYVGGAVIEWLKSRAAVQEQANKATDLALKARHQQVALEQHQRLFDYCMRRAESGGTPLADCNTIRSQLGEFEPYPTAPGAFGGACGWDCWPWVVGGLGVGLLAGYGIAKRYKILAKD